jgi:hypothetical protein
MIKNKANFSYILEDSDLENYAKLSPLERLLWLESIFELTIKAESELDYQVRQYFREDRL